MTRALVEIVSSFMAQARDFSLLERGSCCSSSHYDDKWRLQSIDTASDLKCVDTLHTADQLGPGVYAELQLTEGGMQARCCEVFVLKLRLHHEVVVAAFDLECSHSPQ